MVEGVDGDATLELERARSWAGYKLDGLDGGAVGRVEGAYVDASSERVEWLLARMGRFGHHCLVPARDAVAGVRHVWVPYTREQMRRAPRIDPGAELDGRREAQVLEHYGVDGGRAAEIAARDGAETTARPA